MDKIAIIGLGYVGLPLAHAFANKDYKVVGFDINQDRIDELNRDFDRTLELETSQLIEIKDNIKYSSNLDEIKNSNIYIVTVPTPIDSSNEPDLTPIIKSTQSIASILKKDDIVIYESTVYPGAAILTEAPIQFKKRNKILKLG